MSAASLPSSSYSPPFKVVSKYFITAIGSFVFLALVMLLHYDVLTGHHFQPKVLALNHVAALGWISMIIFGAMFQLVPVVLEARLYSTRLAEVQYWIYTAGTAGLVYCFWEFETGWLLILSALLLNLAVLIFAFNIYMTMKPVPRLNMTGRYLASGVIWLSVTALLGLLLSINLGSPFLSFDHLRWLNLHAHLGFAGWITFVVMGVSYKLIPMFTLSHDFSSRFESPVFWCMNAGLLGIMLTGHTEKNIFFYASSLLIAAAVVLFLIQISHIFKHRVRRHLDTGIKYSAQAYLMMGLTMILGLFVAFVDSENISNLTLAYGVMILFGYISLLISGQMYKIVPFLVWYDKYSSKVGKEPVPLLKEMINEKTAELQLMILLVSSFGAVFSLIFQSETGSLISFSLMFAGSLIFLFNMIYIFRK
ncbi:MAG: hypothetical protein L6Q47_05650 [Ignavibacteriaceae bacterium]|nr:hypothetical protein [Ignavibacteriaceae bacterium]